MPSPEKEPGSRGYIIPIGGAEDKVQDRSILSRFFQLSGEEDAKIAIIPTASSLEDTGDRYKKIFENLGATAFVLAIKTRTDADNKVVCELLDDCTGIFMTGGK